MIRNAKEAASSCMDWYYAFCNKGQGDKSAVLELKETAEYIQQLERERDALRADLEKVCEVVNTCLACGHYRTDWQKPGCELNDLTCKWSWRGVPKE